MTKAIKLTEIENELRMKAIKRGYSDQHVERFVRRTLERVKRNKGLKYTRQEEE